jgi:hypothetical protein
MHILRDLLTPLQQAFPKTAQGEKRQIWDVYILMASTTCPCNSLWEILWKSFQIQ